MDPLGALSIATGIVTFVDFGTKLVKLYLEIQKSNDGRSPAVSALEKESRELSGNATHARDNIAALQARYPRQSETLARLAVECAQAEKDLQSLTDSLAVKTGTQHGLRVRGAHALVAIRSRLKQGDIDGLQGRLRSIREQLMMAVIICIADDAARVCAQLSGVDNGVGELRGMLQTVIDKLHPEFATISRSRPLETDFERDQVASGLLTAITMADQTNQPGLDIPPAFESAPKNDGLICDRILSSLEFKGMTDRENQIENPFPQTFQWLLDDQRRGLSPTPPPTRFKEWLETETNQTPYWITGNPASGKSTLMKYIATNPQLQTHLQAWSGDLRLLICSVYFWNPGLSGQKSQAGLLSTILHQLLSQRPELCRRVAWRHYQYIQLTGPDRLSIRLHWTFEQLRDSVLQFLSLIEGTDRLALFVDGLDEYEGDPVNLISFLKQLHKSHNVKLCVSSRPWNIFKDEFRTYPSLRMELLTKADIETYVCERIGSSPTFQELRRPFATDIRNLESQIIDKADGVFLWVVLVVESLINTARENNDLREIWRVFHSLPPGLEELYSSMRERLDTTQRERASTMYQLLFRWNELVDHPFGALEFWTAANCHDPTQPQPYPKDEEVSGFLPVLERRLAGATGGILQIHLNPSEKPGSLSPEPSVGFLHRTVFDWLWSIRSIIEEDGPTNYDPALVLTSVLVSRWNSLCHTRADPPTTALETIFCVGQSCNHLPETRAKLLRIIGQLELSNGWDTDVWNSLLQPAGISVLSSHHISRSHSFLATCFLCPEYLQAKLESDSCATGLELPWRLHMLPTRFLDIKHKILVALILDAVLWTINGFSFVYVQSGNRSLQNLNLRLKTLETLVRARFAPCRFLRAEFERRAKDGYLPKEFLDSVRAVLEGKELVELTTIARRT
jgi:hypothetical protein